MPETFPNFTQAEQTAILAAVVRDATSRLSDAGLDELVISYERTRQDQANHGLRAEAEVTWQFLVMLADIQAERRQLRQAIEDALFPSVDLGEIAEA